MRNARRPRHVIRRLRSSELGGLAGDGIYVAIWQGAMALADLVQIALIAHALGLSEYGRFALVVAFVALVGQFFDVRIGVATVTFGARRLRDGPAAAAAVVQFSLLVAAAAAGVGFVAVAALAPAVAPGLIGGDGVVLVLLYGFTLLASIPDQPALAMLRLLDRFRLIAVYTVLLEAARIGLVVGALAIFEDLVAVVIALVIAKVATGAVNAVAVARAFRRALGVSLTSPVLGGMGGDERRNMLKTVVHTNIVGYGRLAQVQAPTLLLGALTGTTQAGIYKLGMAVAAMVGKLMDPASGALLPRFSRLWTSQRITELRSLVVHASLISVPVMAVAFALVVVLQTPLLQLVGGTAASDADTVLVLAAAAQALYGAVFWDFNLLYATERAAAVAAITLGAGAVQVAGVLALVPTMEATGAALAFLASQGMAHGAMAVLGLRTLKRELTPAASGTGPRSGR